MKKVSRVTIALFCAAMIFYLAGWAASGIGLAVLGFFCEICMYVSMFADDRGDGAEQPRQGGAAGQDCGDR